MNNKILITVSVPSVELNYDMYVPVSKSIYILISLIVKGINELNDDILDTGSKYILLDECGKQLDFNKSLKELNLKNGDILFLI